jgi:uncharacterized SAM-binding protein YcdF (DUF218 family)
LAAALACAWLPATPWAEYWLVRGLESRHPTRPAADYPVADAIVVLGGTVGRKTGWAAEAEEVHGARAQLAARLFRAGRAPTIVATGSAYVATDGARRSEALDLRDVLVGMGVPPAAVLLDDTAANTAGNAVGAARLLPRGADTSILLVTSAWHMPRALAAFRRAGFAPHPAPAGVWAAEPPGLWSGMLPAPIHAARVAAALKEYVGLLALAAGG